MSCDICPLCAEIPHRAPDQNSNTKSTLWGSGLPGDKGTGHRMGTDSLSALGIRRGAGLAHPMVGQRPIMPRIIAGIPSRTNPLTSSACCRIAFVIRGSLDVSVTTTPFALSVSSLR